MNIIFFARKTLLDQPGGDTIQVQQTIKELKARGQLVKLVLSSRVLYQEIKDSSWDVIHSINLGRFADQYPCYRIRKKYPSLKWVISSVLVDYSQYEGKRNFFWKYLPNNIREYLKMNLRGIFSGDRLPEFRLVFMNDPLMKFAWTADLIVSTTLKECNRIKKLTGLGNSVQVIHPGVEHITPIPQKSRKGFLILGRLEGIKNQIEAVNAWTSLSKVGFKEPLTIVGSKGINHKKYIRLLFKKIKEARKQGAIINYNEAIENEKLSALLSSNFAIIIPSLFETFGLTSIEGLNSQCQVILSKNAESSEELKDDTFVCSPDAKGIREAVLMALENPKKTSNLNKYSWRKAAENLEKLYENKTLIIAFSGSRGMPNKYGGYEELVDQVSRKLSESGNRIWVSTSSNHPDRKYLYPGVLRKFHWDPAKLFGSFSQIIYDWASIWSINRFKPDAHISLGTTSSGIIISIQKWVFNNPVAVHLDGLEWKRGKYSSLVRKYLKFSEWCAGKYSQLIISDNPGITKYSKKNYKRPIYEISYGANKPLSLVDKDFFEILNKYKLKKSEYALMISRLVPENHIIEVIGELISITKIVIVGNWSTAYGKMISKMYQGNSNLIKIESQYDQKILNSLRQGSGIYVHGHSVGGTNPGLLQAMAANCKIIAHDNIFNRSVMENEGAYFELGTPSIKNFWLNKNSISQKWEDKLKHYRWEEVSDQYYVISRKLAERDY